VLSNLRDSREALETATVEKLQHTSDKLKEVTSATEVAATDILDASTARRTSSTTSTRPTRPTTRRRGRTPATRSARRSSGMMGCLQFQDITTQQLSYASTRADGHGEPPAPIAKLFDPAAVMVRAAIDSPDPQTFDQNATGEHASSARRSPTRSSASK
jgi:hypothetical protein